MTRLSRQSVLWWLAAVATVATAVALSEVMSASEPQARPSMVELHARNNCAPPFRAGGWPGACWRPYSSRSPFNRRVPRTPRLHSDSAQIVRRLAGWGPVQNLLLGTADTRRDFSHPIYYSQRDSPVFRVRCMRWRPCPIDGLRVRIPDEARAARGGDGHMAVIDQRSGWEYDFWQVRSKPKGGGVIVVSHGDRTRLNATGLASAATAAQFALLAGIVRPQELAAGRIPHALFLVVRCSSGHSVYPSHGPSTGAPCRRFGEADASAPAMGTHFWLDMSEREIARLPVPAWKRTILRALRRYGGYIGDTMNGNGSWGVMLESGASYTSFGYADPWESLGAELGARKWRGTRLLNLDEDVEWDKRLKILDPCAARATCR